MKIILVSGSDKSFDGRTTAIFQILKKIGHLKTISPSMDSEYVVTNPNVSIKSFVLDVFYRSSEIKSSDVIFIDGRVTTLAGLFILNKIKHKVLVYDSRELYLFKDTKSLKSKLGCIIEGYMIKKADFVIAANEERKAIMKQIYSLKNEILVFENYRKLDTSKDNAAVTKYDYLFQKETFSIISTSGCDLSRRTLDLIESMRFIKFKSQLILIGCSEGKDRDVVTEYINKYDLNNVILLPKINLSELKSLIKKSSLGIAMYHKLNANNLYCSSGKIFEFLYEGIPVATSDNPPLKNFIDKYNVGSSEDNILDAINYCYENYKEIKKNVNDFISLNVVENKQVEFQQNLKTLLEEKIYDRN